MERTPMSIALLTSLIIVAVVVIAVIVVRYVRNRGIEGIRNDVYKLFLEAEHRFNHGDNSAKLQFVCEKAYAFLPKAIQLFVTPEVLKLIIDEWFKSIKDLLDDGKLNGSSKET